MTIKENGPHPVDIHVGSRVRLRRILMGMSQDKVGKALGVTFQQQQKYERGANRISASRLFEMSKILDVPVSFFFDDMPKDVAGETVSGDPLAKFVKRSTLEFMKDFVLLSDHQKRAVHNIVRVMVRESDPETTRDIIVGCLCGWQGSQTLLQDNSCPACSREFEKFPKMKDQ